MSAHFQTSNAPWRVSLDFGTAWSKAALAPRDAAERQVRPVSLTIGSTWDNPLLLASALFITESHVLFGQAALAAARERPNREALRSFKSILSAADLEQALTIAPKRAVDPEGAFSYRDLIILYLAYAWASVERGVASDGARPALDQCGLVFTLPLWPAAARATGIVRDVIMRGGGVCTALGPALLAPEGVSIVAAKAALDQAGGRSAPRMRLEGCVLEAVAAAVCHVGEGGGHFCVLDMGAGTTDFAGLSLDADGQAHEVNGARRTITEAGDVLDRIVLSAIVKASGARSAQDQSAVWRLAAVDIRRHKEAILSQKSTVLRLGQKIASVSQAQVWKSSDAKAFLKTVEGALLDSLEACARAAKGGASPSVTMVAAGGGAGLDEIVQMMARAKVTTRGVRLRQTSATPAWAKDPRFGGHLAPVFPQLAVAMGAAIAHPDLIIRV